jgi:hypothetical protein
MSDEMLLLLRMFREDYPLVEVDADADDRLSFRADGRTVGVIGSGLRLALVTKDRGSKEYDFSRAGVNTMLAILVPAILSELDGIRRV